MIRFILPYSYCNTENNLNLIQANNYTNLFYGVEGNLAYCILTGRANNNWNLEFMSYEDFYNNCLAYNEISNNLTIIDFGNTLLESFDYEDAFGEIVLKSLANKSNFYFEVADENFIDFLIQQYPKIQIILHDNYTIFHSEEEISALVNKYPNNIKMIEITILNLCENLTDIPKIGILNLDSCFYCPQYPLCLKQEHQNILRYRSYSQFNSCNKKKMVNLDSIIDNLKILLNCTDIILFSNIEEEHLNDYMILMEKVLEKEREGGLEK